MSPKYYACGEQLCKSIKLQDYRDWKPWGFNSPGSNITLLSDIASCCYELKIIYKRERVKPMNLLGIRHIGNEITDSQSDTPLAKWMLIFLKFLITNCREWRETSDFFARCHVLWPSIISLVYLGKRGSLMMWNLNI